MAFGFRTILILSFLLNFAARILMLLAQDFRMFAAEAVLEGMAAALNSGTISGYVYSISGRDSYDIDMAEINRCSDLGFLVSTLGFSVIYQLLGMRGLLFGTAAAAFAAFLVSCGLQKCPVQREKKTERRISGRWKMRENNQEVLRGWQILSVSSGSVWPVWHFCSLTFFT